VPSRKNQRKKLDFCLIFSCWARDYCISVSDVASVWDLPLLSGGVDTVYLVVVLVLLLVSMAVLPAAEASSAATRATPDPPFSCLVARVRTMPSNQIANGCSLIGSHS